uniref:Potassium voltage-gated channel subfamily E member 2 n=1 Tax=Leptobrachium leishanense TaxID=445787 RepID=A0A8C5MGX5_9ANUR
METNFTLTLENTIKSIFENYMNRWRQNVTEENNQLQETMNTENFDYVILYLMVMIGMFSFIVVAILVSTVRSKRNKNSDDKYEDPYHRYIANDWTESKTQLKGLGPTQGTFYRNVFMRGVKCET